MRILSAVLASALLAGLAVGADGALEPGTFTPRANGKNGAVKITVPRVEVRRALGGRTAPAGTVFAILDLSLENVIPLTKVAKNAEQDATMGVGGLGFGAGGGSGADEPGEHVMASTPYEIPDLRDHAFLVVNGDELVLVSEAQDAAARPLSLEEITVPKLGAVVEGQLVYEVPERGVTSLAFRYLDSAWGHVDLALLGKAPPRPKAIAGPASNDLLEVVVYAVEEKQEAYGARAPPGKRLAVIHAGFTNRDEENVVRVDLARYATLRDGREAFRAAGGAKGGGVLRGEVQLLPRALRRGALVFEVAERHGPLTLALKLPEYGSLTLALPRN